MKSRTLLIALGCLIFLNVLFALNKTYVVDYYELQYLTYEQYKDYIKAIDDPDVITSTEIRYFRTIPRWTINLIYLGYFAVVMLLVFGSRASNEAEEAQGATPHPMQKRFWIAKLQLRDAARRRSA